MAGEKPVEHDASPLLEEQEVADGVPPVGANRGTLAGSRLAGLLLGNLSDEELQEYGIER